jgi:hypothetical protein
VHQTGDLHLDVAIGASVYLGTLSNSGLYDIQGDVKFSETYFDPNAITNSGTIRKSDGTGAVTLNVPFTNNSGILDSESGTFALVAGTHNSGTFSAGVNNDPQAVLQFTGSHTFRGAFTGS